MKEYINRIGKFYSKVIMKYIGIFLFVGLISVLFGANGWYPIPELASISKMAYGILLPCLIGFAAGEAIGGESSGVIGLLATVGIVAANSRTGILGAMIMGPICGYCGKKTIVPFLEKTKASLQMLMRNLFIAVLGGLFCLFGFFVLAPILEQVANLASAGIDFLIVKKWIIFSSVLIEPAKVLFLNNGINHAILTPLGIDQVEITGKSILFLLETNPGPGLGVLLALFCKSKTRKEQYAAGLFVQGIGGIHEVYFPFILANIWLILPLILGGMAGTFVFALTGAGLEAPVSPGSIITILLMAERQEFLGVLLGILIATAVSFLVSFCILTIQKAKKLEIDKQTIRDEGINQVVEVKKEVHKIGFLCNGGVGSSVMGAALFRRQLKAEGITDIDVKAYAADEAPDDLDIVVCQGDFQSLLPEKCKEMEIFPLENLVSGDSYKELMEEILSRRTP